MTAELGSEPRVTVIVTFCNQQQWVNQALDSVVAQTELTLQLLIADDGSTDGTPDAIESWRERHSQLGDPVFAPVNGGLPALLNLALPHVRGRFVMVLNGDDWLDTRRVENQADALDRLPGSTAVVYSDLRVVDLDGRPTGEIFPPAEYGRPEGQLLHRLISGPLFGMPCIMVRRAALDSVGPWDQSLIADDFDFLLRVAAVGYEFAYLPSIDTNYRQYGGSLTGSRNAQLADGRITALMRLLGRDEETDRLIHRRIHGLALALHSSGYERRVTQKRLRFVLRRAPSRRAVRAVIESYLRIRPGRLSPQHWARRCSQAYRGRAPGVEPEA